MTDYTDPSSPSYEPRGSTAAQTYRPGQQP
jgi:hypothetical protein